MSKVTWKPGTLVYPIPAVMVSCGDVEKYNLISYSHGKYYTLGKEIGKFGFSVKK